MTPATIERIAHQSDSDLDKPTWGRTKWAPDDTDTGTPAEGSGSPLADVHTSMYWQAHSSREPTEDQGGDFRRFLVNLQGAVIAHNAETRDPSDAGALELLNAIRPHIRAVKSMASHFSRAELAFQGPEVQYFLESPSEDPSILVALRVEVNAPRSHVREVRRHLYDAMVQEIPDQALAVLSVFVTQGDS